ncbi:MAG: hypothetical protein ACI91F_002992 [Candidatus Binatia bacterium]|jgi:hypothetical protein
MAERVEWVAGYWLPEARARRNLPEGNTCRTARSNWGTEERGDRLVGFDQPKLPGGLAVQAGLVRGGRGGAFGGGALLAFDGRSPPLAACDAGLGRLGLVGCLLCRRCAATASQLAQEAQRCSSAWSLSVNLVVALFVLPFIALFIALLIDVPEFDQ